MKSLAEKIDYALVLLRDRRLDRLEGMLVELKAGVGGLIEGYRLERLGPSWPDKEHKWRRMGKGLRESRDGKVWAKKAHLKLAIGKKRSYYGGIRSDDAASYRVQLPDGTYQTLAEFWPEEYGDG